MKLTRRVSIVLPLAATVAAATAGGLMAAGSADAATSHAAAAPAISVYDCANKPVVRPKEFDIFCDGSGALVKLAWTSWNGTEATGTGVQYVDNCLPNCAQGKWTHENAVVVLWRGEPVAHHKGQKAYSKMTLLYPASGKTQTLTPPGAYN
jgi:hypothetical protein